MYDEAALLRALKLEPGTEDSEIQLLRSTFCSRFFDKGCSLRNRGVPDLELCSLFLKLRSCAKLLDDQYAKGWK